MKESEKQGMNEVKSFFSKLLPQTPIYKVNRSTPGRESGRGRRWRWRWGWKWRWENGGVARGLASLLLVWFGGGYSAERLLSIYEDWVAAWRLDSYVFSSVSTLLYSVCWQYVDSAYGVCLHQRLQPLFSPLRLRVEYVRDSFL